MMHIVSKFQFFIHIFTVEKTQKYGLFKVTYFSELISYKLHIYVKIMLIIHISQNSAIIKTFSASKHKRSKVHFSKFKTWDYCSFMDTLKVY